MQIEGTWFESTMQVRPSDVDMFQHVHNSHYLDYVLAARYDQMERCYGMAMPKFLERGLGWVVRTAHVDFKRPLGLGETFTVGTHVVEIERTNVRVEFRIDKATGKRSCDGWFLYTMVGLESGKAQAIPEDVVAMYSV